MESHTARVDPGQAVFAPSVWQRRIQFLKSQPAGRPQHASPLFYYFLICVHPRRSAVSFSLFFCFLCFSVFQGFGVFNALQLDPGNMAWFHRYFTQNTRPRTKLERSQSMSSRSLSLPSTRLFLLAFMAFLVIQTAALAQSNETKQKESQPQKPESQKPYIEPAEMKHGKAAARRLVEALPQQNGRWDTLPLLMPINPVHVALMHTGKVLIIAGSGNDPDNKNFQAAVWRPGQNTVNTFVLDWDMFCNGMVILPDGRPFVLGGTLKYDDFLGYPRTSAFNPATATFTNMPNMSGGRWYPTGTVLGDGSVLVLSGLTDTSSTVNTTVQIFT